MIEWIKLKAQKIILISEGIVIIGLILFITISKSITINKTYNTTSNSNAVSNSMAYSGSMAIGYIGGDARGQWIIKSKEINATFSNLKNDLNDFLNTLDPIQFLFCKIIMLLPETKVVIYYPEIMSVQDIKKGKVNSTTTSKSWKE